MHWAFVVWVVSGLWLVLLGLVRTVVSKRAQRVSASAGAAPETVTPETADAER